MHFQWNTHLQSKNTSIRWKYLHLWEKIFNIGAPVGKVFHEMKILAFATKDTFASLGKVFHYFIRWNTCICDKRYFCILGKSSPGPSLNPADLPVTGTSQFPQKISCKNAFLLFKQPFQISYFRYKISEEEKTENKKTGPFQFSPKYFLL